MTSHIGKFEIIRTIGKGSMGEVFLGKDPELGREVAIKAIQTGKGFDEAAKAAFELEAKTTARLNHPNIVTIFDFGYEGDMAYIVMEHVQGDTLEGLMAGGAAKDTLLALLVQVCDGLSYAHEEGLIHRDVKPSNVIVSMRGKRPHAKLADFGVAESERINNLADSRWAGTIHYMAPEYLKSGRASQGSDIFALGVVLYQILSGGRRPFNGENTISVLSAILSQQPEPLTVQDLGLLPPALLPVAAKALEKEPAHRYQSADLLGNAIMDALKAEASLQTMKIPKAELTKLVVGKGGRANCLSLRVAMRQAAPGAQIRLLPGVYRESILIDKDIQIAGEGDPTKIVIEGTGPSAIRVKSGKAILVDLTLSSDGDQAVPMVDAAGGHLTLKNCGVKTHGSCAVSVDSGAKVLMQDCVVVGHGLELVSVLGEIEILGGHVSGATKAAVSIKKEGRGAFKSLRMGPGDGVGILLEDKARLDLDGVVLDGFDDGGLEMGSASSLRAKESRFLGSDYAGLIQKGRSASKMEGCRFNGHGGAGLHSTGEAMAELRACMLNDNMGFGVSALGSGKIALDACEVARNQQAGVVVYKGGSVSLSQCRVMEGQTSGVHCFPKAEVGMEQCEIKDNAGDGMEVETSGRADLRQCTIHDNNGAGVSMGDSCDVRLDSCVVQHNDLGSIVLAEGGRPPTLLGSNTIEGHG